ncbi:SMODS domain-containing nucleotidyltransferase [Helicobacter sp. MIT 14-3879]|uniref:SMODS domain-containing nucleotidyltransferase n=1 Tax=Helicobacter sp. MIT 14-3879 TaxID=2040649 RepID=UPI000E1F79ED|nr:nucleotidyltransferase domain-containing protein [Helicobacter sp. MIT 14-3879]RDU62291.1 nucleotidyltransferase [Helicobacter sp. MIT 14-3879]
MSVNSYLNGLAERAIVRDNEKNKIKISIDTIYQRLKQYDENDEFSLNAKNQIDDYLIFGSYKRGTMISRQFDDNSDVDIMVVFGKKFNEFYHLEARNNYPKKPQTYLNYLKEFAESKYPTSICKQSFPAVVLELNHIKFDLVPAIIDDFGYCRIPNKQNWYQTRVLDWISTNPNDLDGALANNQTLRRLVRVAKIWNAKQGHIYESYGLEKWIVQQHFSGDLSEHFYSFCELLPINSNLSQDKKNRIEKLKKSAKEARDYDNESCIKDLFE